MYRSIFLLGFTSLFSVLSLLLSVKYNINANDRLTNKLANIESYINRELFKEIEFVPGEDEIKSINSEDNFNFIFFVTDVDLNSRYSVIKFDFINNNLMTTKYITFDYSIIYKGNNETPLTFQKVIYKELKPMESTEVLVYIDGPIFELDKIVFKNIRVDGYVINYWEPN